jgi:hypothetical protein
VLIGMRRRILAELSDVNDAKTLEIKLPSTYMSKLEVNIFEIRDNVGIIKLMD